ncbi:MAG: ATP-binding protein, partial [Myxococcota bacterium]
ALVDLAFQITLSMEVILERAESYREAEVMAKDARTKADLLATVSHEIRTPLNVIINLPERIRQEFGADGFSGNQDVVLRSLSMLERGGAHLLNLVNDILDVSRIDAGEMRLRPADTSAVAALEDALASCSGLAEKRSVSIDVEADDHAGELLADPLRLTQILTNLVANGVKYSKAQSRVTVRALDAGDRVCFSVEDRGIGIGLKDQERIFERYIRLHAESDDDDEDDEQGTGLGLHITRKLVELHEGSIWVESELGRGSTFHVELPRRARSLEMLKGMQEKPSSPPQKTGQDHTILLVDDDATVLETAELLLEELGHALVSTTDVSRIDELIQNHRPSLMLLDVKFGSEPAQDVEPAHSTEGDVQEHERRAMVLNQLVDA